MKVVATCRGLIPRDQLQLAVLLVESHNSVELVTEWRIIAEGIDAPHVRRDVQVLFLASDEMQVQAASLPAGTALKWDPPPSPPGANVTLGLQGSVATVEQSDLNKEPPPCV